LVEILGAPKIVLELVVVHDFAIFEEEEEDEDGNGLNIFDIPCSRGVDAHHHTQHVRHGPFFRIGW
jgi:hypothetical protein